MGIICSALEVAINYAYQLDNQTKSIKISGNTLNLHSTFKIIYLYQFQKHDQIFNFTFTMFYQDL